MRWQPADILPNAWRHWTSDKAHVRREHG